MKPLEDVLQTIRELQVEADASVDRRILQDAAAVLTQQDRNASDAKSHHIRKGRRKSIIMKITIPVGIAAAIAVAVFLFVTGYAQKPATAAEVLQQAVEAASSVKTMHITGRIREVPYSPPFVAGKPAEPFLVSQVDFEHVSIDADFVPLEIWKESGNPPRWRCRRLAT